MILVLCTTSVPVAATLYSGDFLTAGNGTSGNVTGGVWYDYYAGMEYGFPGPITKTFTLPTSNTSNIRWARLEVVTYIGNSESNYPITIRTVFNGGSSNTTFNDVTSNSSYSWDWNSVNWLSNGSSYASRVSSDLVSWYDVKDYISNQTVTAYVSNFKPDGTTPFDGRIKAVILMVAYNDPSTGKEFAYYVNQGHDVCTYLSSPEYNFANTTFATSTVPLIGLANLSALYISSYNGIYHIDSNPNLTWSNPKQGSYFGSTYWNVTSNLTQGSNTKLYYERNQTHSGNYSGYFKLPLALLTVENRKFTYDFSNGNTYGTAGTDLKAYKGGITSIPGLTRNDPSTEITSYTNLASDNSVYELYSATSSRYAAHRFNFTLGQTNTVIDKLSATWNGIGSVTSGTNGAALYIWNETAYELLDTSADTSEKVTLTGSRTSAINNYVDSDKKVSLLVVQKSKSGAGITSTIQTDYIKLQVERKIT